MTVKSRDFLLVFRGATELLISDVSMVEGTCRKEFRNLQSPMQVTSCDSNIGANMKDKQPSRLHELLKGAHVVMFSTLDQGVIRSRPMAIQRVDEDKTIWLLCEDQCAKIDEIRQYDQVNITFMDLKAQKYISLSGPAQESRDIDKIRELWNIPLKAWFPDGPEKGVRIIKTTPEMAEYWSTPSSAVVHAIGLTKAILSGEPYNDEAAEHVKVTGEAVRY